MKNTKKSSEVFSKLREQIRATEKKYFSISQVVTTSRALQRIQKFGFSGQELVTRHQIGDWGDSSDSEKRTNEHALHSGMKLISIYRLVASPWLQWVPRNERSRLPTVWVQSNQMHPSGERQVDIFCPEEL